MVEFKDKQVQKEYDDLMALEDELSSELEEVQKRIRGFERLYEQE